MFEEVIAFWLVFPRATKASESDPVNGVDAKMQVDDGRRKGGAAVMVAFDGENVPTTAMLGGAKDRGIG